jgi:hypothetical protein
MKSQPSSAESNLFARISALCPSVNGFDPHFDILPALKREDSHGTAPLGWDLVVHSVEPVACRVGTGVDIVPALKCKDPQPRLDTMLVYQSSLLSSTRLLGWGF